MSQLAGRRVLLTGALGTLGQAQAVSFAEAGAEMVLLDLPEHAAKGAQVCAGLRRASYLGLDLNDLSSVETTVKSLVAERAFDILINNAALIINKPFEAFSIDEYEDQIRVNSSAAFALVRAVAPGMKAKGYGKIINFCSITLNGRWDGYVPYVASKGAMLGLTKSLARELGPHGIRVNAVSPGAVVSEAEARVFADRLQAYNDWIIENQCLKERILPKAVSDLVMFLASPASDMITGQNINVDGGW
jgi:NAD(P)-dependent dehydrogenase (short-subunit alcohol dehydrogenase family)